eukprot:Colp12_sorted_trinity150504_noHs@34864
MATAALFYAAQVGDVKQLRKACANRSVDINARDGNQLTPLHYAVSTGDIDCVAELVRRGADVNATDLLGSTPLHRAADAGHEKIVEFFIRTNCADVVINNKEETPADAAQHNGHVGIARLLAAYGNSRLSGTPKDMRRMQGKQSNKRTVDTGSMLLTAAKDGERFILAALLNAGENVNSKGPGGKTAAAGAGGRCFCAQ